MESTVRWPEVEGNLNRARAALDACPSDSPDFPRAHRAFCAALDAHSRYHACQQYIPAEGYGSICSTCGYDGPYHRDWNDQGGAW